MDLLVMPRSLDIKNNCDFFHENLCQIVPQETITIFGFDNDLYYSEVKAKIIHVLSYLTKTNLLILDLTGVTEISLDAGAKFLSPIIHRRIKIVAIASYHLHKKIKRFGIEVFSTKEEYQEYLNDIKKIA